MTQNVMHIPLVMCLCHMTSGTLSRRVQYHVYSLKKVAFGRKKGSVPFTNSLERTLSQHTGKCWYVLYYIQ